MERVSFVCQAGKLEPKALLLAASLRLHFPSGLKLVAAHPYLHGRLNPLTVKALLELGVEIAPVKNPLSENYLIGHKLSALNLLDGRGLGAFLDSDILVMRKPDELSNNLAAVPASGQICSLPIWQHIYRSFGVRFPENAPETLNTHETTAPYYNSGMIAIPGEMAVQLSAAWAECAKKIDIDPNVPDRAKRPYLDQTSFPIAAALLNQSIKTLGPQWNFPSWIWRIQDGECPIFFHYQNMSRLLRQPMTRFAASAAKSISPTVSEALMSETLF